MGIDSPLIPCDVGRNVSTFRAKIPRHSVRLTAFLVSFLVCASSLHAQQIEVPRVEAMPKLPQPYEMRDWQAVAVSYDSLVFDRTRAGQYLPLVWINEQTVNYPEHPSFGLHTVVGTAHPESAEAINALPALIGASLSGVDKTNHFGRDWVLMAEEWFNRRPEENVYLNHPVATSGGDWWYDTMPNVFFYQLYDLYPGVGHFDDQFTTVAARWLRALEAMGGSAAPWSVPSMHYRAWHLATMTPNASGVEEPEAAGALAWLLYNAYVETGELQYRQGAEWAMEFLDGLDSNPSYELQMPYGAYAAARMNAEIGTRYDVEKMVNWCFEVGPLRNWGVILGNWGGYDVDGLVGEAGSNGYAFAMNTFEHVGALVPLVRYDDRFARAIGKWVLNASNAARLFYTEFLPDSLQDSDAWSRQHDPQSTIAHEALRQYRFNRSPYATGDAIDGGWGATNLALYGASHVGIFGGIIDTTNVPGILKLDARRTDFFQAEGYPTYVFYNPHEDERSIELGLPDGSFDLYDAARNAYLVRGASGAVSLDVPSDAALLAVVLPSEASVTYEFGRMLADGRVADYNTAAPVSNHPPRIKGLATSLKTVAPGSDTEVYCTAEDAESDQLEYEWSASSGMLTGEGSAITWTAPDMEGEVVLRCEIRDAGGLSAHEQIDVDVSASVPVISSLTAEPKKVDLDGSSTLTCTAEDPAGGVVNYIWDVDGGAIDGSGGRVMWMAPSAPGEYTASCTAESEGGGQVSASTVVVVRDFSAGGSGDLVAHYKLDGDGQDASGFGHHGVVAGAVETENHRGDAASALRFDGEDDVVRVPSTDALNFRHGITLAFWIRTDAFFERESYPISHGNWERRWKVSITDGRLRWTIKTVDGIKDLDSEVVLEQGVFYHVVVRYDGTDMEIYVDGRLDAFDSYSGDLQTTDVDLTIGQALPENTAYGLAGVLDEVRIYDHALSTNAVLDLHAEATSIGQRQGRAPAAHRLLAPYPNPFLGSTEIQYEIAAAERVSIRIFDVLGRRVATLIDQTVAPGLHRVTWSGSDRASAGTYFIEMRAGGHVQRRSVVLVR